MSIASQLQLLQQTKSAIKSAIQNKGVPVGDEDSFASYADKIERIEGYEIDINKVDYSIGSNSALKISDGRILQGFANMVNYHSRPLDASGNWLDVDWSKDFEIGVAFKFTSFSANQAIFASADANIELVPTILWVASDITGQNQLRVLVSTDGSSWEVACITSFVPTVNTFYFIKMKYESATKKCITQVTSDFINWTVIENDTLSAHPYYNGAGTAIGGRGGSSSWATNNLLIDTFNTYIKDDSGEIIWGTYAGAFDDGKYPVISGEYQLYDYIESDGTQVIDLGFAPTNGSTVTTSFVLLSTQTSEAFVYGATDSSAWLGFAQNPASRNMIYENNTSGRSEAYIKDQQHLLTLTASRDYTNHLCMFGFYLNGYAPGIKTKLCYCKYNDDFYLPCRRKSDGVFGLYDVANKAFLTDSANGNAFVGGNPIGVEV